MDTSVGTCEGCTEYFEERGYYVLPKDRVQRLGAQAFINMAHWDYMVTGAQEVLMKQTQIAMSRALADKLLGKFPTDFEPQSIDGGLQIRVSLDVILPPCPSTS